jgi:predicted O-methyltransferase YrrM
MATVGQNKIEDPNDILRGRMDLLLDAPAWLLLPERLLLYSLVRGLRPQRCLEIGTFYGGSTVITAAALDDVGAGALVCVDLKPQVEPGRWATIAHRATMIVGPSPQALAEARTAAGGDFDFIFIDGDHKVEPVTRDIEGVLGVAAPGAHLLFHDANFWQVREAIDACVAKSDGRLLDCGMLSTMGTAPVVTPEGITTCMGGFRMLRIAPDASARHEAPHAA